jgi:signal peptidase II
MKMTNAARSLLLLALIGATVGCDRVTKHIATTSLEGMPVRSLFGDTIRLEYAENTGGFLSIGADLGPGVRAAIFTIGTGLLLVMILIAAFRLRWHGWKLVGCCLAFAGGASNWLDRSMHGAVVDFLNIGLGEHLRTGIFNVADVTLMLGVCILMFQRSRPGKNSDA